MRHGETSTSGDDHHEGQSFDSEFPRNGRPGTPCTRATWGSMQVGQEAEKFRKTCNVVFMRQGEQADQVWDWLI